jgi:peptide-methionine (S)-S-oxide reductase
MISYTTDEQQKITVAYIDQLTTAHVFKHKIVTQVLPLKGFYPAEAYHQNYATLHPNAPYIMYNDAPKVDHLKKQFNGLYRESPQLVAVK